jgi:hypothetical protein
MARAHASRFARVVIASVAVMAALLSPAAASPAAAAEDGLSLTSSSTYTLVPEQSLVHVTIALTAKNTKPNLVQETPSGTITTRYFFESASIAIHAEATAIQASAGKKKLGTQVTPDDGFSRLRVDFPRDLYFDQTVTVSVSYDLPGGAPRSESDIRVGSAFATFYAWAFGDRGDVTITVPGGYNVDATGSPTQKSAMAGTTTFEASGISDVTDWYTIVVADKVDALTNDRLDLPDGEHLVIRAWPEDTEWRTRVHDLLQVGLPVLVEKIGLDWPVEGDVQVTEVHTPLLEGYAGIFYANEDRIEISEDLDELTIIHEASHAWFNEKLFVGRWIGEGLADEYASRVLDEVSNGGLGPEPISAVSAGAVPLNAWGPPGRIADDATEARETYGYEASWTIVRALVNEIGEERMRNVLVAADAHQAAYVGAGKPETITYDSDWRRLLDLLEERGGSKDATALFRQTVVTDDQKPLLVERAAAREAYARLVTEGKGWLPGYVIRDPMGRWEFADATAAMTKAHSVLDTRAKIEVAAAALGVEPPTSLRTAYEGATTDLAKVQALADRQLATEADLATAGKRLARERPPVTAIGLIGEDPGGDLAAARSAFSAGDLDGVDVDLASMNSALDRALELGQQRVGAGAAVVLGVAAAGGVTVFAVRRRRRRVAEAAALTVAVPAGAALPDAPAAAAEATPVAAEAPPAAESPAPPKAARSRTRRAPASDASPATAATAPPEPESSAPPKSRKSRKPQPPPPDASPATAEAAPPEVRAAAPPEASEPRKRRPRQSRTVHSATHARPTPSPTDPPGVDREEGDGT